MARSTRSSATPPQRVTAHKAPVDFSYAKLATRPLHVLVFLLPLIVAYEIGSARYLTRPGVIETVQARRIVRDIFDVFGAASFFLPGAALVAVLLAWHIFVKDRWRLRPAVLIGMLLESALWTMPLLVLAMMFGAKAAAATDTATALTSQPWQARLTLAIGAGLYEELLFRLVLITFLHFVLVDLAKVEHKGGCVLAVLISAVAFAFYHKISDAGNPGLVSLQLLIFYTLAGAYFGAMFFLRGFGIVVGAHALYDAIVLLVPGR